MTRKTGYLFAALLALAIAFGSAPASSQAPILTASHPQEKGLAPIDEIIARQIEDKKIVGAVIEIGQRGTVFYREAFGYREVEPAPVSMTPDTIFDLASLTKPVATSVAIMQLRESGKIKLDVPVARYWPEPFQELAHSYIMAHLDEAEAFRTFLEVFPESTLLVDTYSVRAAIDKIIVLGRKPGGVRLDSGDVLADSIWVRNRLNAVGWNDVKIFASGDLDEYRIDDLIRNGATIDAFGVGTSLSTSADAPFIGAIYKLVEVEAEGISRGTAKFSEEKKTYPGKK